MIGAAVTVTDADTNQTFTAVTDKQGHFKIEGLPAGTYTVTVSAQGFSESRRADVKVEEGAVATTDFALEIAPVEVAVTVTRAPSRTLILPIRNCAKPERRRTISPGRLRRSTTWC